MKYLSLIIVVVVIGIGWWFISSDTTNQNVPTNRNAATTTTDDTSTVPANIDSVPDSWVQYQDEARTGVQFTIAHPPSARVAQVQPNIFEVTYVGPNSEPATEITDGYFLSWQFATGTLPSYLAEQSISTTTATRIAGFSATQFTRESELGTSVTHYLIDLGDEQLLDVGVTVAGASSERYRQTIAQIIDTLSVQTALETENADSAGATIPDVIRVSTPTEGAAIASPVQITGEARGTWFFEASAPVVITDWDGRIIGEGFVEAEDNWMTESFVPFSGEVSFTAPTDGVSDRGAVILQKANPSGLPENDAALEISVTLQ